MAKFAVLLPAAGRSSRFKDKEKKPFATLDGRAVWLRTAEYFVTRPDVAQCLLVIAPDDLEKFRMRYTANIAFMNVKLVPGGRERWESVGNALAQLSPEVEFVAVHDAVRPCVTTELIDSVFAAARTHGAALLATRIAETVKRVDDKLRVQETVNRQGLWQAQTPQVFRREWLTDAYDRRAELGKEITDDAQLVEAAGHPVHVVEGSPTNIKITTKDDLALAAAILTSRPKPKGDRPFHPFAEEEMWK
ncbi:MAG TPA: 2-C-methyl-D-erythritol 4-phosphate cytidylyltransferase [Gemmataceae bacterium]|jgi:2-C-methyl-D-erythritol 4-phosphate cytidylyltransferase|nr:2-C-methyl-D-erythritol 4-phosphate cytidylyltransferase [Gemmataceae bacterium]